MKEIVKQKENDGGWKKSMRYRYKTRKGKINKMEQK